MCLIFVVISQEPLKLVFPEDNLRVNNDSISSSRAIRLGLLQEYITKYNSNVLKLGYCLNFIYF